LETYGEWKTEMIAATFAYSAPTTIDEAMRLFSAGGKPLAGGMSLIPMMKLRLASPEHLVDLRRLKELNYIRETSGELHIGATTTHAELESSSLLRERCPLLAETAAVIGDMQVRNQGTIGGSIAHADPSADYPAALFALEARVVLRSASIQRIVPVDEFLLDSFTTALEPGEIVIEVMVPKESSRTGTSYMKMPQPASGFAMVGVACRIERNGANLGRVRVGLTGVSNLAYRAKAAEKSLEGSTGSLREIQDAAQKVTEGIDVNSDLYASAEFRAHLAATYAARAMKEALARSA
jgi:aerobic carbon-monoxide dehydrogenase medium subunit